MLAIAAFCQNMVLLPLLALLVLSRKGENRDEGLWWLALAMSISWLADLAAIWNDPYMIGAVYPLSQTVLVAAVVLHRQEALGVLALLFVTAFIALMWQGAELPSVFFRIVAWGYLTGILYRENIGPLRIPLLIYFGFGLVAWIGYSLEPGWSSYLTYQGVRLVGLLLLTRVVWRGAPRLVLA